MMILQEIMLIMKLIQKLKFIKNRAKQAALIFLCEVIWEEGGGYEENL